MRGAVIPLTAAVVVALPSAQAVDALPTGTGTADVRPVRPGPPRKPLYVTESASDRVSVIDTATDRIIATIPVGRTPIRAAVGPDGSRLYVTDNGDDTVSVIDTATDAVVSVLPVGEAPFTAVISPDGTRAYVANLGSSTVSVIDLRSGAVVDDIDAGRSPRIMGISPDGSRVYVTSAYFDTMAVIDTAAATTVAVVQVGRDPRGVAVSPDGSRVYVAANSDDSVSVIDAETNTVITTIQVGDAPVGLAVGRIINAFIAPNGTPASGPVRRRDRDRAGLQGAGTAGRRDDGAGGGEVGEEGRSRMEVRSVQRQRQDTVLDGGHRPRGRRHVDGRSKVRIEEPGTRRRVSGGAARGRKRHDVVEVGLAR
ncbi:beta-propeller fold lactonase family protein [Streptosporangium sp. NPDC004379]|uniref:YVTN family beta-propeller repeat protein n=1 Tax=Streptosporangium sp. NPDC004379 TaxID=3366189 RepID=UPI0036D0A588